MELEEDVVGVVADVSEFLEPEYVAFADGATLNLHVI